MKNRFWYSGYAKSTLKILRIFGTDTGKSVIQVCLVWINPSRFSLREKAAPVHCECPTGSCRSAARFSAGSAQHPERSFGDPVRHRGRGRRGGRHERSPVKWTQVLSSSLSIYAESTVTQPSPGPLWVHLPSKISPKIFFSICWLERLHLEKSAYIASTKKKRKMRRR